MNIRKEQCNKVCRILDDVLANRPTERDSLIIAVRKAFESLEQLGNSEQLPSAQPDLDEVYAHAETEAEARYHAERKKGKWIDRGWSGDGRGNSWHEWECSECKHITKGAKWDFCPNCGADMREPEDIPMEYFESGGR